MTIGSITLLIVGLIYFLYPVHIVRNWGMSFLFKHQEKYEAKTVIIHRLMGLVALLIGLFYLFKRVS
jgi:hypothetical protein